MKNLPNLISLSRFVFGGLFLLVFYLPLSCRLNPVWELITLTLLFLTSEFTDFLDGYMARKKGIISPIGKLLDPFTDTLAHITFLFCFYSLDIIPVYLLLVVIYRELSAIFLRLLFQLNGKTQPARILGKIKSNFYAICVGMALIYYASLLIHTPLEGLYWAIMQFTFIITVLLSIISFIDHLIVYLKNPHPGDKI